MDMEYVALIVYEDHNKRMEDEHHRMNHRIMELEKTHEENHKLLISVEKLALCMENMQKEQAEQGERLDKLEDRDGENWRKSVGYIMTTVIGLVIGYLFKQIGLI